jgi:hypothetical protein
MQKIQQKIFVTTLALAAFFFVGVNASQASSYVPKIDGTKSVKANALTLNISCAQLTSKKVSIKVQVKNNDTDSTTTKTATVKLNSAGASSVKIDGLDSGTSYGFKLKVKKTSDSSYSSYSEEFTASTSSKKYTPIIKSIKSIKDTSLTLSIVASQLKKKAVNVNVQIRNNDADTSTNKVANVTLDKNGKATINITSLESGTEYSFKIQIKKTTDKTYSLYSAKKTAQTKG